MKAGLRILTGILLATIFTLSIVLFRRPFDPVYRSKCASQWAEDLLSPDYTIRNEAQIAFQFFGEDGVPQLRVLLQRRSRPWEPMLARMNEYTSFFSYKNYDSVLSRQRGAEMVGLLGEKGKEAIPDLIAALAGEQTASEAERALIRIGKRAEIPLQEALRNNNPEIRERAAGLLKEFDPISGPAIAALLDATRDRESRVRKRSSLRGGVRVSAEAARCRPSPQGTYRPHLETSCS